MPPGSSLTYRQIVANAKLIAGYACELCTPDLDARIKALQGIKTCIAALEKMPTAENNCTDGCHMVNGYCVPDSRIA